MKSIPRYRFSLLMIGLVFAATMSVEASSPRSTSAEMLISAGCAPLDSIAIDLKDELVDLMGRTDAMADTLLAIEGIARVPTTQITYVTDPTTCSRAADAYSTAISVSDPARLVHAIRAGIRYLVIDPNYLNGPNKLAITFDSSFTQQISSFMY